MRILNFKQDINHSGDGGIYAELIQNRAFQGATDVSPFSPIGAATLTLQSSTPALSSALPQSMNIAFPGTAGVVGFSNPGYWGIEVSPQKYTGSFYVEGDFTGDIVASFVSDLTGQVFTTTNVTVKSTSGQWTQYNYTLNPTTSASNTNNSLAITFDASDAKSGSLNFNLISLFPPTYNNRPNGLRPDLMTALKALNPSYLRIPGGNNLEGEHPPNRWVWNNTIGPLTSRPGRNGTWGYPNTDGLGLVEYLQWCIDLKVEPILAVWDGLYLDGTIISQGALGSYVQDTLDELDFIMGDVSTPNGALRAQLGYGTSPIYNIKYIEIGNEDNLNGGGDTYASYRLSAYYDAIHTRWPNVTLIASTIAYPSSLPDSIPGDYHQYTTPDIFVSQFNFFDQNSSTHPTLVGEYATIQPNGADANTPRLAHPIWIGAVAEAVFLLGTERNSDAILGASYAPLFQNINSPNVNGGGWAPDLISFTADPSQDTLSTSYRVIQLFSNHRIAQTLSVTSSTGFGPAYYVAGTSAAGSGSYILKAAVYNSTSDVTMNVNFPSISAGSTGNLTLLTAPTGYSYSDIGSDVVNSTTATVTAGQGGTFSFQMPNLSVAVLVVG